jgi:hypothetical protein
MEEPIHFVIRRRKFRSFFGKISVVICNAKALRRADLAILPVRNLPMKDGVLPGQIILPVVNFRTEAGLMTNDAMPKFALVFHKLGYYLRLGEKYFDGVRFGIACKYRQNPTFYHRKFFSKKLLHDSGSLIIFLSLRGNNRYEGR